MKDRSNNVFVVVRFLGDKDYATRKNKTHFDIPFGFDGIEGVYATMAEAVMDVADEIAQLSERIFKPRGLLLETDDISTMLIKQYFPDGTEAEYTIEWQIREVENHHVH